MAGPTTPEFTDSFIVQTDNYGAFMGIVKQNVIKYCSKKENIWQDVLPPEQPIPKLWFHVRLYTDHTQTIFITLAIRMDNLYLVGFKTPAGEWWEFNNKDNKHLIKEAKWLGFGGSYQDLIGQKGLETVMLGRAQMTIAVITLAKHGTKILEEELQQQGVVLEEELRADPYAVPKTMLAKLVIMICEGLRFLTVSGTVYKKFENPVATITQMEGKQVNKWDRISVAVFVWAKDPSAKFPDLEKVGVKDKNDAARVVALVKDQN